MTGATSDRQKGQRRRNRWWVVGGVVGALAVSGALVAVLNQPEVARSEGGQGASARSDGVPATEPGQMLWRHTWPKSYSGPVWITVEADDDSDRDVLITWGALQRTIVHAGGAAKTYHFRKGDDAVPIAVEVVPDATVTFDAGPQPPDGAIDINAGWFRDD